MCLRKKRGFTFILCAAVRVLTVVTFSGDSLGLPMAADGGINKYFTLSDVRYASTAESKWRCPQHRVLNSVYRTDVGKANARMEALRQKAVVLVDAITSELKECRAPAQSECVISPIIHKIWLTSSSEPRTPLDESVRTIPYMCQTHPECEVWLWTNVPDVLRSADALAECRAFPNFKVMDCGALNHCPIQKYVDHLVKERYYAHASNLLRLAIVHEFGGVHTDLGFIITELGMRYIRRFTHAFNTEFWDPGCCGHATFAAVKNSRVLAACISVFVRMDPSVASPFQCNRINLVSYSSPAALAAFTAMELRPDEDTLLLFTNLPGGAKVYDNWHSMGSYKSGALGNRTIEDSSGIFPWLFP